MEAKKIKSSWSEILVDVLGEIMGKLFFPDQVRACAVCKNWFLQSNKHPNKQTHMFPWFFRFTYRSRVNSQKEISCQLYDPFNPTPILSEFVTDNIQKSDEWNPGPNFICRIVINYDCVLFYGEREIDEIKVTQFFLYSIPSTEKIPTVPDLRDLDHIGCDIHYTITTFTSHPKSPNCVFFVLREYSSRKITISSLKVKERRWITKEFTREIESNIGFIVFIRGILYCLSGKGNLESYELATGEWNLLFNTDITGWNLLVNSDRPSPCKMLESNGDLLLVYLEKSEIEIKYYCCLLMFDFCEKKWVPKTSLTDRALFLGLNSFSVSAAADETRNILANKIYFLGFGSCKVFSFKDGKFYWFKEGSGLAGWDANELDGGHLGFWIQPRDYFGK